MGLQLKEDISQLYSSLDRVTAVLDDLTLRNILSKSVRGAASGVFTQWPSLHSNIVRVLLRSRGIANIARTDVAGFIEIIIGIESLRELHQAKDMLRSCIVNTDRSNKRAKNMVAELWKLSHEIKRFRDQCESIMKQNLRSSRFPFRRNGCRELAQALLSALDLIQHKMSIMKGILTEIPVISGVACAIQATRKGPEASVPIHGRCRSQATLKESAGYRSESTTSSSLGGRNAGMDTDVVSTFTEGMCGIDGTLYGVAGVWVAIIADSRLVAQLADTTLRTSTTPPLSYLFKDRIDHIYKGYTSLLRILDDYENAMSWQAW
ncbi:unnamed protein product [Somion occarium]|uniref:Uncharacterized protein n=1 Tax=Somion occarium TaxID=3059160 RepID=A0ABP1E6J6_9APHY